MNNNNPRTFNQKKNIKYNVDKHSKWRQKNDEENLFHFNKIGMKIIKSSLICSP